jgi:hypothetical protein
VASNCGITFVSDPVTGEAQALLDKLLFLSKMGYNRIEVNSGCDEVIKMMMNEGNLLGPDVLFFVVILHKLFFAIDLGKLMCGNTCVG